MRPTTKIIIGVTGSIFILSLLFIIGFSFSERRNYTAFYHINEISIPQENITGIYLDPHRVIVIEEDFTGVKFEDENRTNVRRTNMYIGSSNLTINQIAPEMENKLYIPEALKGCIATKMNNDTLTIQIKDYELRKKFDKEDSIRYIAFSGVDLCLQISNVNVINKSGLLTKVSNIETDSIKIDSNGDILIEFCKANFINPGTGIGKLTVKNSVVKTIHLDLNRIRDWNLDECDIEVQNFTGSDKHNITLDRNKTGKINWLPKNENAELNIKVPGDTVQIVFQ